jgi:long-chain fatty acid transport protein
MKLNKIAALIAIAGLSTSAFATNGYFSHGYGIKAKGMGGVGIALPQDSMAAATNPAGMVMVGNGMDFGVDWFRPIRGAEIVGGNLFGADGSYSGSDTKNFLIPEFGYNRMINPNLSLGVSVYGNGGMNSDYGDGIPLFGAGKAGVNLMQLFVAPTAAYKVAPNHAIGVSLNLAYQRFSADGLQNFIPASVSGANLTNRDNDTSKGVGFRIGYTGKLSDMVTVGATYQSKTKMSKFSKYKGLFAEGGDFDIPENYGVGIAVKATPALTVAFDVVEIKYSAIKAIANPLSNLTVLGNPLGSVNGPGFGWQDMTVYKLGFSYEYSKNLTLRAGYNHGKQPIPSSETLFNILAPGVVENHLTLGATWTLANKDEISVSYMHAFENKVKGSASIPPGFPPGFGGGEANLKMKQDALGISYSWKM